MSNIFLANRLSMWLAIGWGASLIVIGARALYGHYQLKASLERFRKAWGKFSLSSMEAMKSNPEAFEEGYLTGLEFTNDFTYLTEMAQGKAPEWAYGFSFGVCAMDLFAGKPRPPLIQPGR